MATTRRRVTMTDEQWHAIVDYLVMGAAADDLTDDDLSDLRAALESAIAQGEVIP